MLNRDEQAKSFIFRMSSLDSLPCRPWLSSSLTCLLLASSHFAAAAPAPEPSSNTLPTVDLGYTVHQALSSNDTGGYYNFSNIQFGTPPTEQDRFRAVKLPTGSNSTVTNGGAENIVCPQSAPSWNAHAELQLVLFEEAVASKNETFYNDVLSGVIVNTTKPKSSGSGGTTPGTTEDCLFLDLMLPHSAWEARRNNTAKKAPVIIWLYGGGYTSGDKRDDGQPADSGFASGLVTRSIATAVDNNSTLEPTIVVAPNYRLGLFGWLGGETLAADGTPNAGLYDQRLAMDWVQKYIHLFGGDAERVTVMGESAGAGSIEYHITSYGGKGGKLPFQRAIPQSPVFDPAPANDPVPEDVLHQIFNLTNTTCLDEVRALPSAVLQKVNKEIVANSTYGFFMFGPTIFGEYAPDLPGRLLQKGQFHKDVQLLIGHNLHEPFMFVSPSISNTTSAFNSVVEEEYPFANASVQAEMESLYPPIFDGSEGYVNAFGRVEALYIDYRFVCNNEFLADALPEQSYWYTFAVPPATHGLDIEYTWATYPPKESTSVVATNAAVATAMQEFILSFAADGKPVSSKADGTDFPVYGAARNIVYLSAEGITQVKHKNVPSCEFWQRAPYAG